VKGVFKFLNRVNFQINQGRFLSLKGCARSLHIFYIRTGVYTVLHTSCIILIKEVGGSFLKVCPTNGVCPTNVCPTMNICANY